MGDGRGQAGQERAPTQRPSRCPPGPSVRPGSRTGAILQLQRNAGNAAVAGLLRSGAEGRPATAQRTRGGLKIPETRDTGEGKLATANKVVNHGAELVGTGAAGAGTYGAHMQTGLDTPATYVGNSAGLLAGGILLLRSGVGAAQSFVRMWRATDEDSQHAALDEFGEHVVNFKDTANPMVANAAGIAETAQQAAGQTGFVAGAVSHTFGAVGAYGDLAKNMVSWAGNWMVFQGLQEVQVSGWSDPAKAVTAAKSDQQTASTLHLQAMQMTSKLGAEEQGLTDRMFRNEGYIRQIEEGDPRGLAMAGRDLDRLKTERAELQGELGLLSQAKQAAITTIMTLEDAVTAAKDKARSVAQFAARLQAQDQTSDPSSREIPIEEIKQYMVKQQVKKLRRDTLRIIGSAVGLAAGITIVALGWTPIGWGLAAAAGMIGATVIIAKAALWIYRKVKGQRPAGEVYAERLWSYAKTGLAGNQTDALGEKMMLAQRTTARKLLSEQGLAYATLSGLSNDKAIKRIRRELAW